MPRPSESKSRLAGVSEQQSRENSRKKLDAQLAALEKELANLSKYKEDPYITKLKESNATRMNLGKIKEESIRAKTSHTEKSQNEEKIQKLETEYDSLSAVRNKLAETEKALDKSIGLINTAINNKVKNRNPDPKNLLEGKMEETRLRIGDNFVGLGGNIVSKNFSNTGQVKETLNTVSGRTSSLYKAEEYKENVRKLSHKMDALNDQMTVKNLTARNASDLLEMLEKTRTLHSEVVNKKIAVERDMRNINIDIKYLEKEEHPKQKQFNKPEGKQSSPIHTR